LTKAKPVQNKPAQTKLARATWGGRFSAGLAALVLAFSDSVLLDFAQQ
jgi:hypothetical protein